MKATSRVCDRASSRIATSTSTSSRPVLTSTRTRIRCSAARDESQQPSSTTARREVLAAPLILLPLLASQPALADGETESVSVPSTSGGQLGELYDEILAYKFNYPTSTVSGKPLKLLASRAPEKYSSAAPLTADARQRIVSELLDLKNYVSISMTVGPASGVLKDADPAQWKPFEVALTVLVDRSTARLTSGQRTALNDVEEAHSEDRADGRRYFVYEHLAQGSPTISSGLSEKETYRHALAATTVRPDRNGVPYLYTLNLACRQNMWDDLAPLFKKSIDSFTLTPETSNYIAPDVNPWQFW